MKTMEEMGKSMAQCSVGRMGQRPGSGLQWGMEPWPEPVAGAELLDELERVLKRFVVLPRYGAETLALWILHIVIRMHRKLAGEGCERLRNLEGRPLKRQCARFVMEHGEAITSAQPEIPAELNDRAADIENCSE